MQNIKTKSIEPLELLINQTKITIKELTLAKYADYAIELTCNETIIHCILCTNKQTEYYNNSLLQVNFKEIHYGANNGGLNLHRGNNQRHKLQDSEILISRLIDRAIRPIIIKHFLQQVQITINVISNDNTVSLDILGILAAICTIKGSSIPTYPITAPGIRVAQAKLNGDFKLTLKSELELESNVTNLLLISNGASIIAIDCEAKEVNHANILQAIEVGRKFLKNISNQINEYYDQQIKDKNSAKILNNQEIKLENINFAKKISNIISHFMKLKNINLIKEANIKDLLQDLEVKNFNFHNTQASNIILGLSFSSLSNKSSDIFESIDYIGLTFYIKKQYEFLNQKFEIYQNKLRKDKRKYNEVRPLDMEVKVFSPLHGSSYFTRGSTNVNATIHLSPIFLDSNTKQENKNFSFSYEFPPFATGEAQNKSSNRREIGHSTLCAKGLKAIIPFASAFNYNINLNTFVLSSNGSSSMASICASSLALMQAGVPISKHVAGIAMGLAPIYMQISPGANILDNAIEYEVLSDIDALEDNLGLMDLKIASTSTGITAIQLDVKTLDIEIVILKKAFKQAEINIKYILDNMQKCISVPNKELHKNVHISEQITVPIEAVREIIGHGGRNIKELINEFSVKIDIVKNNIIFIQGELNNVKNVIDKIKTLINDKEQNKKPYRAPMLKPCVSENLDASQNINSANDASQNINSANDASQNINSANNTNLDASSKVDIKSFIDLDIKKVSDDDNINNIDNYIDNNQSNTNANLNKETLSEQNKNLQPTNSASKINSNDNTLANLDRKILTNIDNNNQIKTDHNTIKIILEELIKDRIATFSNKDEIIERLKKDQNKKLFNLNLNKKQNNLLEYKNKNHSAISNNHEDKINLSIKTDSNSYDNNKSSDKTKLIHDNNKSSDKTKLIHDDIKSENKVMLMQDCNDVKPDISLISSNAEGSLKKEKSLKEPSNNIKNKDTEHANQENNKIQTQLENIKEAPKINNNFQKKHTGLWYEENLVNDFNLQLNKNTSQNYTDKTNINQEKLNKNNQYTQQNEYKINYINNKKNQEEVKNYNQEENINLNANFESIKKNSVVTDKYSNQKIKEVKEKESLIQENQNKIQGPQAQTQALKFERKVFNF